MNRLPTLALLTALVTATLVPAPVVAGEADGCGALDEDGRASIPDFEDVVYGIAPEGVELELDVWVPPGEGPFASILMMHGAFGHGDKVTYGNWAHYLCQGGFVVFNANYRLTCSPDDPPRDGETDPEMCTEATAPDPTDDVAMAMRWIRENASTYNGNPNRVGAVGGSGGATLSLNLATQRTGPERPEAVVAWSGMTKLWVWKGSDNPDRLQRNTERYIGCAYSDCPARWRKHSAWRWVDEHTSPLYLANGTGEIIPLAQAEAMHRALTDAGVPHKFRVIPEALHARQYKSYVVNAETGLTVERETLRFLRNRLTP